MIMTRSGIDLCADGQEDNTMDEWSYGRPFILFVIPINVSSSPEYNSYTVKERERERIESFSSVVTLPASSRIPLLQKRRCRVKSMKKTTKLNLGC